MSLRPWYRQLGVALSILLVLGGSLVTSSKVSPPIAHAATTWTPGSGTGSGAAPWESFTGISLGAGLDLSVNAANGNLLLEADGHDWPQINGLDLVAAPLYNTFAQGSITDMGNGWLMGTGRDVGLVENGSSATFYDETGRPYVFTEPTACSFTPPAGLDAQLACTGSGYTLTDNASHFQNVFNSNGYRTAETNREGNTVSYSYDASNRLTQIAGPVSPTTQFLSISYNAQNLVSQIADPTGRAWTYGYDGSNNLISITDRANNVTSFGYGTGGLTQITDPKGNVTLVSYTFSSSANKYLVSQIVRVTNPSNNTGPTWTFSYGSSSVGRVLALSGAACGSSPTTGTLDATVVSNQVTDSNGHTMTYTADSRNRVVSVTYPDTKVEQLAWTSDNHVAADKLPSGATTGYLYDSNNNLTQMTLATGVCFKWQYSAPGQPYLPSSFTDDVGNTSSFQYNTQGLLTTVTDALNHTWSTVYNADGTVQSDTDANGHSVSYAYNSLGLPSTVTYPSPRGQESYQYDSFNRISQYVDGSANATTYSYDPLDQPIQVTYADNTFVKYGYDPNGNTSSMQDGTGTTSWIYNALDQPTQKTLPNGNQISYTWDGADNLLTKTDGGGTITYGYTVNDELATVTGPGGRQSSLSYDQDGNYTKLAYPSGVSEAMTYNTAGQLLTIKGTNSSGTALTWFSYSYTNPATGKATTQRYSATDAISGNTWNYTYDALNQLTQAVQKNSAGTTLITHTYAYDPVGNLTTKDSAHYYYNAADEISVAGFTFDGNGNETYDPRSGGITYAYNAADQTASATFTGSAPLAMTYTGRGQSERVSEGVGTVSNPPYFQYDLTGLGALTTGTSTVYFTSTPDGQVINERNPSGGAGSYYYLHDGLGSIVALTDDAGNVVNTYSYDPYGATTSASEQVSNPFRYAGAYYDNYTLLYKMGERYYDPTLGRFTQPDPLVGQDYTYAAGNPTNSVDPSGLFECEDALCAQGGLEGGGEPPPPGPCEDCPFKGRNNIGRQGRPQRLRQLAKDRKIGKNDRGQIRNSLKKGKYRNPKGKQLAHGRRTPARRNYCYLHAELQCTDLHRAQTRNERRHGYMP